MTIISDYLSYVEKYTLIYGEKTLILMQVGSFFECYALVGKDGEYYGSNIRDFANINEMAISKKNICVSGKSVVMAGFGLAQLEKYVKRLQEHGYTIVVFTQDTQAKNTTRSLSCIYSPGTFFSNETSLDDNHLSNNTTCIWIHYSAKNNAVCEMVTIGISNIDIYTGKSSINEFSNEYYHNPTTYDELERFISIYNPTETIIISNLTRDKIDNIIQFTNIQSNLIHIIEINNHENKNELYQQAINCERQIYQREILNKFFTKQGIIDIDNSILDNYFNYSIANQSYCFLLEFVYRHNPNLVKSIQQPYIENTEDRLVLANHSLKQLNIITDNRYSGKLSSVSNLLNNCITTMGRRRFNRILLNPITNKDILNRTYNITEYFLDNNIWDCIRSRLTNIKDFEKIKRKLIMNKITPRDFYNLYQNLSILQDIDKKLSKDNVFTKYIKNFVKTRFKISSNKITDFINNYFDIDKCKNIDDISCDRLGNFNIDNLLFIKREISENLDLCTQKCIDSHSILEAIKNWMSTCIEEYEKPSKINKTNEFIKIHETPKSEPILMGTKRRVTILKTIIDKLKLQNNGKHIISYKSKYSGKIEEYILVIDDFEYSLHGGNKANMIVKSSQINKLCHYIETSKDSLVAELLITYADILLKFNKLIEGSLDILVDLTIEDNNKSTLSINILDDIIEYTAECDLIQCRCYIASKYNYCKPDIKSREKPYINFTKIRHPLIEQLNQRELYVTNDYCIGSEENTPNGVLLYGTNAVGKTSFIKSIGIAIIMAQAGLYVPCETFTYSPYNYIFTRILGNDNIFKGLSTFAVEMSELRTILRMCDKNSMVLGDELCSGTESTSALSIFAAGIEHLHRIEATFIFATHFHEVSNYDEIRDLEKLRLCHMSVVFDRERKTLVYDRKIREGPGENMYGLEVCKALDLPYNFLDRAHELRIKYSGDPMAKILKNKSSRYNSCKLRGHCEICSERPSTEVHHLQFQKNADKRGVIRGEFNKDHKANLINICDECHNKIHKKGSEHKVKKTTNGYKLMEI